MSHPRKGVRLATFASRVPPLAFTIFNSAPLDEAAETSCGFRVDPATVKLPTAPVCVPGETNLDREPAGTLQNTSCLGLHSSWTLLMVDLGVNVRLSALVVLHECESKRRR